MIISETSRARSRLLQFCDGEGLDVGFGGDPIKPSAICVDLPQAYTVVGLSPQHLSGSCKRLKWFNDKVLDFVFSSHLIEDFSYFDQARILNEFARVLKTGGRIVLYQPDQAKFEAHCAATGQGLNAAHKEKDYSLDRFTQMVLRFVNFRFKIIHQNPAVEDYSWEIVLQKN